MYYFSLLLRGFHCCISRNDCHGLLGNATVYLRFFVICVNWKPQAVTIQFNLSLWNFNENDRDEYRDKELRADQIADTRASILSLWIYSFVSTLWEQAVYRFCIHSTSLLSVRNLTAHDEQSQKIDRSGCISPPFTFIIGTRSYFSDYWADECQMLFLRRCNLTWWQQLLNLVVSLIINRRRYLLEITHSMFYLSGNSQLQWNSIIPTNCIQNNRIMERSFVTRYAYYIHALLIVFVLRSFLLNCISFLKLVLSLYVCIRHYPFQYQRSKKKSTGTQKNTRKKTATDRNQLAVEASKILIERRLKRKHHTDLTKGIK